jgi:energy-coupling factor transport system ATP-binding protein
MLDPQGKKEIRDLLTSIRKAFPSLTILAITHDVEEAVLADQVLVLKEGQLVFQGTPDTLFRNETQLNAFKLKTPFVYQLIREFPKNVPNKIGDIEAWAKSLWR